MMLKKIILIFGTLLLTSFTYAWQDDLYVGADIGYQSTNMTIDNTSVATGSGTLVGTFSDNTHLHALTIPFYLGYRIPLTDKFAMALEASIDASQHKQLEELPYPALTTINFVSVERTLRYGYRVDIIPSYQICNGTLLYARAGYARAQFYARNTGYGSDPSVYPSAQLTQWLHGLDVGIGMQSQLVDQWFYRVQYIHTFYKDFTATRNDSSVNASSQYKTSSDAVMFGIGYDLSALV